MAFPQVISITPTSSDTPATSHLINMPASVTAGNLLLLLFANEENSTVTTPDGWDLVASSVQADAIRLSAFKKVVVGTEGGTQVDCVINEEQPASAQVYEITAWWGALAGVETAAAVGSSSTPNPPALSPSWGSADNLFIANMANNFDATTGYPTNYTDGASNDAGAINIGSARRELAASTDNPGTFSLTGTNTWVARTLVIRPAQSGGGGGGGQGGGKGKGGGGGGGGNGGGGPGKGGGGGPGPKKDTVIASRRRHRLSAGVL